MHSIRRYLAIAAICAAPAAHAAPFTAMYTFGDNLSDTGNISALSGGVNPPAPYSSGRFSDGPIWVDAVANALGLPSGATAYLTGGNNYAFGGARTGSSDSPPGLLSQYGVWSSAHATADPNALFIVFVGLNDMRTARSAFTGSSAADDAGREAAALAAVNNITTAVNSLAGAGARNILLVNLWDLGLSPEAQGLGLAAASTDASNRFNSHIAGVEALAESQTAGLDVRLFDLAALVASIRQDALTNGGAQFGITNVSSACGTFSGSSGADCNVSLYADGVDLSSRASTLLGNRLLSFLGVGDTGSDPTTVPEPGTLAMFGLALLGLFFGSVRRPARR